MPEIKNTFLAGKMNKSLDDRLLPEGEYRDALNIQVTKNDIGEDSNVGVVHTIKGNTIAHTSLGLSSSYEVIGTFFDERNNTIYWFVTDDSNSRIYKWINGTTTLIVSSSSPNNWLNFNKSNKITGVNLLEDLLFWTDNRNQPRRIDVTKANNSYYDREEKVSVAKYAPWEAPLIQVGYESTIQSNLLEEEFARFAYRYKYINNEYSIISPFSQIAFEMGVGSSASNIMDEDDKKKAYRTTENPIVINRANKVDISIPLPSTSPTTDYEIVAIDILYKESDTAAVRVIETIDVTDSISQSSIPGGGSSGYYIYTYKSTQPKSTLPEDQITRAFDNVPLRALAQEVVGNRVVYGNITQNYELPTIDYQVYYSAKNDSRHPHHSIKQRRTYEVGIVLVDKYGRTSPVILSSNSDKGASYITVEAKTEDFKHEDWNGDSLKVAFNEDISGIHVLGDASYDTTLGNDLGWYSYRIVVKQAEQEYYNVYNPGISFGYMTLHNDNINKVPRNTDNSIDTDGLYPTRSRLYPKVINYSDSSINGSSLGWNIKLSDEGLYKIQSIGTAKDHGLYDETDVDQQQGIFEQAKFHLLGKLEDGIPGNEIVYNTVGSGVDGESAGASTFCVFETEPFKSSLDIFYETSTSGVIEDLNDSADASVSDILLQASNSGTGSEGAITFSEAVTSGSYIGRLRAVQSNGDDIPYETFTLNSVTRNSSTVTGVFEIEKDNSDGYYKIKTSSNFYFDSSTSANNIYTLSITSGSTTVNDITISVTNAPLTLTGTSSLTVAKDKTGSIYTLTATNGSADETNDHLGLSISSHVELHDNVSATAIFTSAISGNTVTISSAGHTSHTGINVSVTITITDGISSVSKTTLVYISLLTESQSGGSGGGLSSYTAKYEGNSSQYSTASAACSAYNSFPDTITYYADAALSTAPQIYRDSYGDALAPAGWYHDGSTVGLWKIIRTSTSTTGEWDIDPTSCIL